MKRTKEEAQVTRKTLLDAALVVFSRAGYADTRLEDIAEEAGVTRGAIYHHFGGKAELYSTLMAEATMRVMPVIESAMAEGGSPIDLLRRMFVRSLAYAEKDEVYRSIMELTLFKTAITPELEAGMQMKLTGIRRTIDSITATLLVGIESGLIRHDIDARQAAITFTSLQNGVMMMWLMDSNLFSLKRQAEAAADNFIQGISAN